MVTGIGAGLIHTIVNYATLMPLLTEIDLLIVNSDSIVPSVELQKNYSYYISQGFDANDISFFKRWLLDQPVVVGASGAVFGLLLAFGMLFPNSLIYIYFAIPIKAKYFVIIYGLLELYSGIQNSAGDNVAHFAHLGGMLFGFLLIKYWRAN